VIGEDESDTLRTATLRAHAPCVLGVLSRADYRRHILRMEQEAKAELVEKLLKVRYLQRVGRPGLLRMAMMLKPVTWTRGEIICQQGEVPDVVTFITSGSAMVTVHVDDSRGTTARGSCKPVEVMEQAFDSSLEAVGVTIAGDDPEPHRWGLRATTVCKGFRVSPNVAKRILNKRHVQDGIREHLDSIDRMIAHRVVESGTGDRARASLGFPSNATQKHAPRSSRRIRKYTSHDLAMDKLDPKPVFSKRTPALDVTPRSLLQPGQTASARRPFPPHHGPSSSAVAPMPPLRLLGGAASARSSGNRQAPRGSPRSGLGEGRASERGTERGRKPQPPRHRATIASPRMPVATHGPHAARARALGAATTGRLAA